MFSAPVRRYLSPDKKRFSKASDALYLERKLFENGDGVESFMHLDAGQWESTLKVNLGTAMSSDSFQNA